MALPAWLMANPYAIAAGPDGNIWYSEQNGSHGIGRVTPAGTFTEYSVMWSSLGITAGPDGNVWFIQFSGPLVPLVSRITSSGGITDFALSGGTGPTDITNGPDGNLWVAEYDTGSLARVAPAGVVTEFAVSSAPYGLAKGADGNLWFTEYNASKIGRFVPP
jgi:streptogramin lyase